MDSITSRTGGQKKRRTGLAHFLRSRRAGLSPEDVGLATTDRRARAGLRREEVAVLAGVSASWYTWLEQGRPIRVSDGILDAISRALRLSELERVHLYRLADANPPLPVTRTALPDLGLFQRTVDAQLSGPSCVIDRYWEILVVNQQAAKTLRLGRDGNNNYLTSLFTGSHGTRYLNRQQVARRMTARFRAQASYVPDDPRYDQMADQLSRSSHEFAELWDRHEVEDFGPTTVELNHSDDGPLTFELFTMDLDEAASTRLLVYLPPGVDGFPSISR
ncbi:helix-turn-helix transcriptional regulator [Streptomyces sp. HNM0663]|uniref:Helix-turn-helix transcriptional regulator n=1 Tax=Streptomyces chengmaiensis TaxID=3040919 RepID=A0ABT6HS60_9ACTN|nr:helix-turn-helix transcriptional regulator [Streptomyces chengmaiensis]MDH2391195.1 helix-turn-helix transcriptional regulator [Streptomyces chengmaiensis]